MSKSSEYGIEMYVRWGMAVHASTKETLRYVHLKAIEVAIDGAEFGWTIELASHTPNLYVVSTLQNIVSNSVLDAAIIVLLRAYALADGWRIHGFGQLARGTLVWLHGGWKASDKTHRPPALEDAMFELEPGRAPWPPPKEAC